MESVIIFGMVWEVPVDIPCIDIDGKHLGYLPSNLFNKEEFCLIGIACTMYEARNSRLKKVFSSKDAFNTFKTNHYD